MFNKQCKNEWYHPPQSLNGGIQNNQIIINRNIKISSKSIHRHQGKDIGNHSKQSKPKRLKAKHETQKIPKAVKNRGIKTLKDHHHDTQSNFSITSDLIAKLSSILGRSRILRMSEQVFQYLGVESEGAIKRI